MNAIVFMPWARMKQSVSLGNVCIEPWSQAHLKADYFGVLRVDQLFSLFFDCDGTPISNITVCELQDKPIVPKIEQPDIDKIRDAVNALTFATIAPGILNAVADNNKSPMLSNADRFIIIPWSLPIDGKLVFKVGYYIQHRWDISRLKVFQPFHVITADDSPNEHIVKDMQKLFSLAKTGNDDAKRIIYSLEWFKLSQTNSPDVTFRSKLVMLITAFETLFVFPTGKKAAYFASQIDAFRSSTGNDLEDQATIDGKVMTLSKKAIWAHDFYKLRNKIVHGDYVSPNDIWFNSPHCKFLNFDLVGCILFSECVARKMDALGCHASLAELSWNRAYHMIGWLP